MYNFLTALFTISCSLKDKVYLLELNINEWIDGTVRLLLYGDGVVVRMKSSWMGSGLYYSSASYGSRRYTLCLCRFKYPYFANTALEIQNVNIIRYLITVKPEIWNDLIDLKVWNDELWLYWFAIRQMTMTKHSHTYPESPVERCVQCVDITK